MNYQIISAAFLIPFCVYQYIENNEERQNWLKRCCLFKGQINKSDLIRGALLFTICLIVYVGTIFSLYKYNYAYQDYVIAHEWIEELPKTQKQKIISMLYRQQANLVARYDENSKKLYIAAQVLAESNEEKYDMPYMNPLHTSYYLENHYIFRRYSPKVLCFAYIVLMLSLIYRYGKYLRIQRQEKNINLYTITFHRQSNKLSNEHDEKTIQTFQEPSDGHLWFHGMIKRLYARAAYTCARKAQKARTEFDQYDACGETANLLASTYPLSLETRCLTYASVKASGYHVLDHIIWPGIIIKGKTVTDEMHENYLKSLEAFADNVPYIFFVVWCADLLGNEEAYNYIEIL